MSEENQKPAPKKDTKTYVVTRPGTAAIKRGDKDLEVGITVELSDSQAAARVNKVRPKDEADAEASKAGRKSKIEKEHGELTLRVSELEANNKALKAEVDKHRAQQ